MVKFLLICNISGAILQRKTLRKTVGFFVLNERHEKGCPRVCLACLGSEMSAPLSQTLQRGSDSLGSYGTVRVELKILATKLQLGFLFNCEVLVMLHFHVFWKIKLV